VVQYNSDGRVIPHYYGENYRGYDIFVSYRPFRGKLRQIIKGRNPYDDRDVCDENLIHCPPSRCFKTVEECKDFIDNFTFLAQPELKDDKTNVLCSSTWDYNQYSDASWSLF